MDEVHTYWPMIGCTTPPGQQSPLLLKRLICIACTVLADVVHVRILPLPGQLLHTTNQNDNKTKPDLFEPRLEPVTND